MQWFKHDSDAATDAKVKKLIIRYGPIGYAIYFHCLELIMGDIGETNITFELEHDSEIIADDLRIQGTSDKSAIAIVEEVMRYIVDLRLFDEVDGHIFCFKLLKRLDLSMTSNQKLRSMITEAKSSHDKVMMRHDTVMLEEKRVEETREEHTQEASVLESIKYPTGYPRILFDKWQAIPGAIPTRDYFNWLQTDFREISSAIAGIDSDIVLKSLDNFKHVRENPKDTWMKANPSMKKFFTGEMFGYCRPEVFGREGSKDDVPRCKCGWELAHNGDYAGQCINDECDMYHKEQI